MKLRKKLSLKKSFLFLFLIFAVSLIFLGGVYYILNIPDKKTEKLFSNGPITTLPKSLILNLDQPGDDSLTFQSSIIISGQTVPAVNVLISTATNDLVIQAKPDGSFSTVLELDEGINRITVVVFDSTGDSRSAKRTVYYSKEKI